MIFLINLARNHKMFSDFPSLDKVIGPNEGGEEDNKCGTENIEDEVVQSKDGSKNKEEFREEKQDVFKVKSSFWRRGLKKLVKKLKPLAAFLVKLRNDGCC